MKIRYAAKTDVGMKRTHNEDYFSLIEDEQLTPEQLEELSKRPHSDGLGRRGGKP